GELLTAQEGVSNPFTYAGQWGVAREGTSQYFMRERSYDPVAGRFIQPDPSGLQGGSNSYAYAGNSPTHFVDAGGLYGILPSRYVNAGKTVINSVNPQGPSRSITEAASQKGLERAESRLAQQAADAARSATIKAEGEAFAARQAADKARVVALRTASTAAEG